MTGISSYELGRALGVTQKTAWFMLSRLRLALQDKHTGGKLGGDVEADETYIGGKGRFMHADKRKRLNMTRGRSIVWQDCGHGYCSTGTARTASAKFALEIMTSIRKDHMQGIVRKHVEAGANVYTDALPSYTGLYSEYVHGVIDHAEAYVDGQIHTNFLRELLVSLEARHQLTFDL